MTTPLPDYFQTSLDGFYRSMAGKNRSPKTVLAYSTDLHQFLGWVVENDATVETVADIQRVHIIDFLASLSERKLTGVSRARKLAAIREYFRYLVNIGPDWRNLRPPASIPPRSSTTARPGCDRMSTAGC